MSKSEQAVVLPFLNLHGEDGALVDHVRNLRPLTDLVIPLETRRAIDRVLEDIARKVTNI